MTIPKEHAESITSALLHASAGDITDEHIEKMAHFCVEISNYIDTLNDISLQFRLIDGVIDAFSRAQSEVIQTIYENRLSMRRDYEKVINHKEMVN